MLKKKYYSRFKNFIMYLLLYFSFVTYLIKLKKKEKQPLANFYFVLQFPSIFQVLWPLIPCEDDLQRTGEHLVSSPYKPKGITHT